VDIDYIHYNTLPDAQILDGITKLHNTIFNDADKLIKQMKSKPNLIVNVALDGAIVIGYKIGYSLTDTKFYSWLGGVDTTYRNLGVAAKLMEEQHRYLKANGYQLIQTKTMNRWRNMLILNIKSGFDIVGTYIDDNGETKIIMEKELSNED